MKHALRDHKLDVLLAGNRGDWKKNLCKAGPEQTGRNANPDHTRLPRLVRFFLAGWRGANWGELVQIHDDRHVFQASLDTLAVIDIHSL